MAKSHQGRIPTRDHLRLFCDALIYSINNVLAECRRLTPESSSAWKHLVDFLFAHFSRHLHTNATEAAAPAVVSPHLANLDKQQIRDLHNHQKTDVALMAARRVHYGVQLPISEKSRLLAQKAWKKMYTLNPAEFTRSVTRHVVLFSGTIRALFLARPPPAHQTAGAQQVFLVCVSVVFFFFFFLPRIEENS